MQNDISKILSWFVLHFVYICIYDVLIYICRVVYLYIFVGWYIYIYLKVDIFRRMDLSSLSTHFFFFWFSFKNVFLRPHFCVQFWNAVFLEASKNPSPLIFWKYLSWLYIVYIVFTCERWNHFLQSSLPAPLFDGFLPPNV